MPWLGKSFVDQAVTDQIITPEDSERWIEELADRTKLGTFFAMNLTVIATAVKV